MNTVTHNKRMAAGFHIWGQASKAETVRPRCPNCSDSAQVEVCVYASADTLKQGSGSAAAKRLTCYAHADRYIRDYASAFATSRHRRAIVTAHDLEPA